MATKQSLVRPHLLSSELTLLDYAGDDSRDIVTFSEKEALVLQLAGQIQEQQLEKALLEQGAINVLLPPGNLIDILFLPYYALAVGFKFPFQLILFCRSGIASG